MMMVSWKHARRVVVFVIGMTVLLIGVAAIFLPVLQAWLIIPVGLAILATEFVWAKRLLDKVKARARQMSDKIRGADPSPAHGDPVGRPETNLPPSPPSAVDNPPDDSESFSPKV